MAFDVVQFQKLTQSPSAEAWSAIIDHVVEICSPALSQETAASEVTRRDRLVGNLDHFLSSAGWDLWRSFGQDVERTSDKLAQWWTEPFSAKAVLILDGLSLRELPWLLEGAEKRGFTLHGVSASASEMPSDTNSFAKAIGVGSRSQLQNNGASRNHRLTPAKTESIDLPWQDCLSLIDASPNWVFWHHWPDSKIHDGSGAGQGLSDLTKDVASQLTSDDFWEFVERLANGRRLVITSDHGYAATGLFHDAPDSQANYLKTTLKSGRSTSGHSDLGPFIPPVAMNANTPHGEHLLAVGRWKWRSPGGYPTLAHGGLSLLEVLSPFVELSKQG